MLRYALILIMLVIVTPTLHFAQYEIPPRFETVDECFVQIPADFEEGINAECGWVTVPENREDPDNIRTIRLAVVVFYPDERDPLAEPIVYIEGGPGGAIMNNLTSRVFNMFVRPVLRLNRSVILIAKRGIAPSEPNISMAPECDFMHSALRDIHNEWSDTTLENFQAKWKECLELLSEITDLSAYHSTAMAADIDHVRRALRYGRISLWGTSYGTLVALKVMRDYPDTVRVVVMDSPLPPDIHYQADLAKNRVAVLERLFEACASDASCLEISPDLRGQFFAVIDRLNNDPIVFSVDDVSGDLDSSYVIDGRRFLHVLPRQATVMRFVPAIIAHASEGEIIEALVAADGVRWYLDYFNPIVQIAVCNENSPFYDRDEIEQVAAATGDYANLHNEAIYLLDLCLPGYFRSPPPIENEPVYSDIPVLLFSGEFDTATPPDYAERIASTLETVYLYTFPRTGHGVVGSGQCFSDIMLEFITTPQQEPDTTCMNNLLRRLGWSDRLPTQ